jgi:hypothetical protein
MIEILKMCIDDDNAVFRWGGGAHCTVSKKTKIKRVSSMKLLFLLELGAVWMVTAAFAVPPPISAQVHRIVDEEELINKESAQLASEAASMAKARQAAKRCVFQFSESLGRFFFFLCVFFFSVRILELFGISAPFLEHSTH